MFPDHIQKILNDADKYFEVANKSAQQFSPDPSEILPPNFVGGFIF